LQAFNSSNNHTTPHVWRKMRWQPVEVNRNYYNVAPAAGVNASISDMVQWLLAQLGQKPDVLPVTILNEMQTRTIRTTPSQAHYRNNKELGEVSYGLGWRIFNYGDQKNYVHHGGWVSGMVSEIVFNRDLQMGMVFLTNAEIKDAGELIFKFLEIYQKPGVVHSKNRNVRSGDTDNKGTKNRI